MDRMETYAFALVVVASVLILVANAQLRRHGHKTSWFGGPWTDMAALWRISCETSDESTRTNLRLLLGAIVAAIVALLGLPFWM